MFNCLVETIYRSENTEIIQGDTGSVRGVRNKVRTGIVTFLDGPDKEGNQLNFPAFLFSFSRI